MKHSMRAVLCAAFTVVGFASITPAASAAPAPPSVGGAPAVTTPRSGGVSIKDISFNVGAGTVTCRYFAGSSDGVGDATHGAPNYSYWVWSNIALDGPSHISGCRLNGADVNGQGANQWFVITAWSFYTPGGTLLLTTPPTTQSYNLDTVATAPYDKATIWSIGAVCAGGNPLPNPPQCTFPQLAQVSTYIAP